MQLAIMLLLGWEYWPGLWLAVLANNLLNQTPLQQFNATLERTVLSQLASAATSKLLGQDGKLVKVLEDNAKLRDKLGVVEVFDELGSGTGLGTKVRNLVGGEQKIRPARTFPAALPWFRLDRIYVRGFKVDTAQVLHGTLWAKLSDHAPIVANLKLS